MDESWEKAMESALEGHAESSSSSSPSPRTLTLDGAVKCLHGRLPPPSLLERFSNLEHLSIANIGLSSLESFPKLRSLQRLTLSDNRIAGGLEFLVEAGLDSLRDLDLSNNRIQSVEDLAPLANLRLVSLDLYECPVTRVKDYRSRVFGMIPSLKYLDKMDADGNERPESDDEEEDDEDEEEYDEEEIDGEDPGNSEIDGEDQAKMVNGSGAVGNGDVDEDEDEESDADEEETETGRNGNGAIHHSNGFHVAAVGVRRDDDEEDEEDEDDDYEEEDEDLGEGEEINEEEDGEEEDVVEAQDVVDSDEEDGGDGVEEGDGGEDEDEDDVEDEAEGEPGSTDRLVSTEGEIDGHEQGEEDDENAGEIGEADDDQGLREDRDSEEDGEDGESEDEEDDLDGEFHVQPIPQQERAGGRGGRNEIDACNEEEDEDEVDDTEQYRLSNVVAPPQPSSPLQPNKRRRDEDGDESVDEGLRSSKHH